MSSACKAVPTFILSIDTRDIMRGDSFKKKIVYRRLIIKSIQELINPFITWIHYLSYQSPFKRSVTFEGVLERT